jgi:TatD DNase family protein
MAMNPRQANKSRTRASNIFSMSFLDSHAHLDQEEFAADLAAVIERAREARVEQMLAVGVTLASSRAAVELAERHEEIYAAVGIHPNSSIEAAAGDWTKIVELAAHPRVVALGETGLDRYWDYAPLAVQMDYFDRHLRLAQERNLPMVIHCRDAAEDLMPMLREAAGRGTLRGIVHAFSGDAPMAEECVALGLHVSFAGNVTYTNKKFEPLRSAALAVPADRLLIETDSPYLTPEPLRGRQKRNEPAYVVHTARRLAELRGVPLEELERQTTANARRLFGLPEATPPKSAPTGFP